MFLLIRYGHPEFLQQSRIIFHSTLYMLVVFHRIIDLSHHAIYLIDERAGLLDQCVD